MKITAICLIGLLLTLISCAGTEQQTIYYENTKKIKETYEQTTGEPPLKHGKATLYYLNGKIQHEAEYQKGALWSVQAVFDTAGKSIQDKPIQNGKGLLPIYDGSGNMIAELNYVNGRLEGISKYYDKGSLVAQIRYQSGQPDLVANEYQNITMSESASESDTGKKEEKAKEQVSITGFDPKQSDELMVLLQKKAYAELHAKGSKQYRAENPLPSLTRYLNLCNDFYGTIKTYRMEGYQIKSVRGLGEVLEVVYECTFGYGKGMITLNFFKEGDRFLLGNIDYMAADYTPVVQVTRMATPVLEKMKAKDYESIYQNAATLFKSNTPINDFRTLTAELAKAGNLESYELYQHHIAMFEGKLKIDAVYKVKIAGRETGLMLSFIEEGGGYKLLSLNL
jgi:hypothetical protein